MPSKVAKDSNAPKKPLSAYFLFSADERPKLKASGLDNFAEMSKALGAAWKQADQKTKTHYEKEYEREKIRYENELKDYKQAGGSDEKSEPATKSKTTKPSTTAKPSSKKTAPAAKTEQRKTDDEEGDDDESEEEEEKPAPPAKSSKKKN